jgi:acetyl-CoA acetyltransferase
MSLTRRAFIAGGAHTPYIGKKHPDFIWKRHPDFGKRENPTYDALLQQAVDGLILDTGLDPHEVDRLFVGNFTGELFVNQGHMGAALVGVNPAFAGKPSTRLEGACASGGLAMMAGLDAIAAGADIVLVAGVEIQSTVSARVGGDYLARAADYRRQRAIDDFTFPALFARRTKAYRERYGVSEEDIGRIAVKAYANANRNPNAHMRAVKMSLEVAGKAGDRNPCFLASEDLNPFIKMSDCSQVSDGASALLLVSEKGLAKLSRTQADAVEVIGRGHAVASLFDDGDLTQLTTTALAAQKAYADSGVSAEELQIAEVHDCFTVTELMMYEAMGLAPYGQGDALIRDGATCTDGRIPVNTGGGLIGFGHPVGATGIKQPLEIYRQMKGLCGEYQVSNSPQLGMTVNMGGDDKTVVSMILRNGE